MIKKTLGLVLLMILLSSCFIKLDEKESKNESNVKINLSNVSREYVETYSERIVVSLLNLSDGKEYLAEGTRESGTKKDMVLADIPYGNYSVSIKIYESGASEPYSIISSTLTVGKEVATFEGVVGGPNQAANLSGSLEYYEDEAGYYYVDFECDKVTSNYVSDTTGDTITYKLYGSIYEDFRDIDLENPLIEIKPLDDPLERHPKNKTTDKDKVVFKLGKYSSVEDSEIPTGITNGGTYYWKVVTCATVKDIERTCESDVKSVVNKKKVVEAVNNLPNKVTNTGISPYIGESNPDYYKFIWGHVTSVSNDPNYNDMTYILYVSTSIDFPDTSDTLKYEQNQITYIQSWESGGIVTVSNSTTNNEFEDAIGIFMSGKSGTIYWRIKAVNSAGSSVSDTFNFGIN